MESTVSLFIFAEFRSGTLQNMSAWDLSRESYFEIQTNPKSFNLRINASQIKSTLAQSYLSTFVYSHRE